MSNTKTIEITIADGVYIITLNRPNMMNAFNDVMALELLRAVEEAQSLKEVRAILFKGNGPVFCAGGDINLFADVHSTKSSTVIPRTMEVLNGLITTMANSSKPIIAAVHGSAAGVGLSFVLAADLIVATQDTKFTMAYSNIGLTPDGGATFWLPRIAGYHRAMQLILLSELFTAEQALEYGIVNWVVPAEQLTEATQKVLNKVTHGPAVAYRLAKSLLNRSMNSSLENQLNNEKHAFIECSLTQDFHEGVSAFMAKKKPDFRGK